MSVETIRLDLHCHSEASRDCRTPLFAFPARCRERGISVQAITDHDQIWGAQKLQKQAEERHPELTVIVGEEITTGEGEIIGLFLQELIPPGQTPEATIAAIKEQGGLVLLPHGFDPLKRHRLKPEATARIAADIDIIEVFNARISRRRWNTAAAVWAAERDLAQSAGSDAHTLKDIGSAWVETPRCAITTPGELLAALHAGTASGEWTHPVIAFGYKVWSNARRKLSQV